MDPKFSPLPEDIRKYLNDRCIKTDILEALGVTWMQHAGFQWIAFPIFDKDGNHSFYKLKKPPEAPKNQMKGMTYPAGSKATLYPIPFIYEELERIVICEGEPDALVLLSYEIEAVTSTHGAGTFKEEWVDGFPKGIEVILCLDLDESGARGELKIASVISQRRPDIKLKRVCLPDDLGKGGDVTDLAKRCVKEGKNFVNEFLSLIGPCDPVELQKILDSRFGTSVKREKPESEKPTFSIRSVGDLLSEPEEMYQWVVKDMLPTNGISILVAKPKVGKSTEARNLAFAVARGLPYLERPTTQGPVIYLALEEKRSEVRRHFSQMGIQADDPIFIHVGAAPEDAIPALGELIKTHNPLLVIVDPLFLLISVEDANAYAEMTKTLAPLRELARQGDCHILTTHHHTKMERSDGGDGILGSTAIFGAVDTAMIMKKREGGVRTFQTSQRYGIDLPATVVALDAASGQTSPKGELETIQVKDVENEILEVIGEREMNENQIREGVGGNHKLTSQAIRSLLASGKLDRVGGGKRGDPYRYSKKEINPLMELCSA